MTLHRISNRQGTSVLLSTFGARVVELLARDRDGALANIVLGYDSEEQYRTDPGGYFGATVGRVAGRIADSRFVGGGLTFSVQPNEGSTHLHGGPDRALDRVDWSLSESTGEENAVFRYSSPAGEEHYPGDLEVTCSYRLTDDDELEIELTATTDAPTPVNLVNHTYFNLSGDCRESIVEHELMISAHSILEADLDLLPLGGIVAVAGSGQHLPARSERCRRRHLVGPDERTPARDPHIGADAPGVHGESHHGRRRTRGRLPRSRQGDLPRGPSSARLADASRLAVDRDRSWRPLQAAHRVEPLPPIAETDPNRDAQWAERRDPELCGDVRARGLGVSATAGAALRLRQISEIRAGQGRRGGCEYPPPSSHPRFPCRTARHSRRGMAHLRRSR